MALYVYASKIVILDSSFYRSSALGELDCNYFQICYKHYIPNGIK